MERSKISQSVILERFVMTDEEFRERLVASLKDPTILFQLHTIIMAATKDIRK